MNCELNAAQILAESCRARGSNWIKQSRHRKSRYVDCYYFTKTSHGQEVSEEIRTNESSSGATQTPKNYEKKHGEIQLILNPTEHCKHVRISRIRNNDEFY